MFPLPSIVKIIIIYRVELGLRLQGPDELGLQMQALGCVRFTARRPQLHSAQTGLQAKRGWWRRCWRFSVTILPVMLYFSKWKVLNM